MNPSLGCFPTPSPPADKLRFWLEQRGHAVLDTGLTRSALAGKGLKRAKQGNTLNLITHTLVYATDFADRLENQIIPALRAGFIVLTDRYIYSQIARAVVRGADEVWAQLLGPIERDESGDGYETSIALRQTRAFPHLRKQRIVHQSRQLRRESTRSIARA